MEIKQQLRLSQQLVMTPQLQQAIRLLQLSRLELIDEIRKELDANPVLADEEIDPRAREPTATPRPARSIIEPQPPDSPAMASEKAQASRTSRSAPRRSASRRSTGSSSSRTARCSSRCRATGAASTSCRPSSRTSRRATSLVDHLRWQLQLSDFTDERAAASPSWSSATSTTTASSISRASSARTARSTPDLTIEDLAREVPTSIPRTPRCVLREMQEWDPVGRVLAVAAGVPAGPGRGLRLRRPRARHHRQAPAQPGEAQLPGHRARPEGDGRGGLRGRQADPEAREPPGAQLHRDRRQDDRHHARRLRRQGRREVHRHATTTAACSGSTSTSRSPSSC